MLHRTSRCAPWAFNVPREIKSADGREPEHGHQTGFWRQAILKQMRKDESMLRVLNSGLLIVHKDIHISCLFALHVVRGP